jgi:hypothetical protein
MREPGAELQPGEPGKVLVNRGIRAARAQAREVRPGGLSDGVVRCRAEAARRRGTSPGVVPACARYARWAFSGAARRPAADAGRARLPLAGS